MLDTDSLSNFSRDLPPYVRVGKTPDILAAAHEPGVNLVIWQREMPASFDASVQAFHGANGFRGTALELTSRETIVSFTPSKLQNIMGYVKNPGSRHDSSVTTALHAPEVKKIRSRFGDPNSSAQFLADDAIDLIGHYRRTFPEVQRVRTNPFYSLSVVRKGPLEMHQDGRRGESKWRMITTYDGPETVWTPDDNIDQPTLRKRSNEAYVIDDARVYGVGRRSVALIKGGSEGIFHSGPVTKALTKRLGLILIPV